MFFSKNLLKLQTRRNLLKTCRDWLIRDKSANLIGSQKFDLKKKGGDGMKMKNFEGIFLLFNKKSPQNLSFRDRYLPERLSKICIIIMTRDRVKIKTKQTFS